MLSNSSLTVLAIVAFALIGVALVMMALSVLSEMRKRVRAHIQVHRVGSQMMIGTRLTGQFQIGDPGAVDGFVAELVKAGRADEAIQVYQFTKGVGPGDAATAIEAVAGNQGQGEPAPVSRPMPM